MTPGRRPNPGLLRSGYRSAAIALLVSCAAAFYFGSAWTDSGLSRGQLFTFLAWAKPLSTVTAALLYHLLEGGPLTRLGALVLFVLNWTLVGFAVGFLFGLSRKSVRHAQRG
ncbi:MAG: hypothetical protein ABJE47_25535 [bacterium]